MDKETLEELAELSRIALDPLEVPKTLEKITEVERYVEMLTKLELLEVDPTIWLEEAPMELREDSPKESMEKKNAMKNAPKEAYGYFALNNMMEDGG